MKTDYKIIKEAKRRAWRMHRDLVLIAASGILGILFAVFLELLIQHS